LIRTIQDLRKAKNKSVSDKVALMIETDDAGRAFIEKNRTQLESATSLTGIEFKNVDGEAIMIGDFAVKISF
jgi:hypothetical protein